MVVAIRPALTPVPTRESFGVILRRLRIQRGLSQNFLARSAGIDPAYVHRLEKAPADSTSLPSRKVVLALWESLDLPEVDRERLLVAAGHCPQVILDAGGWDAYLDGAFRALDGFMAALEGR